MTESKHKILKDLITQGKISILPIHKPSLPQVLAFKRTLIIAPAKCQVEDHDAGHTYIVESHKEYRLRSKDKSATLPPRPTIPIKPADTKDTIGYYSYVDDRKAYKMYREYNQQTLDLIEEAFPDSLLLMKEEDFLPPRDHGAHSYATCREGSEGQPG